MPWSSRDAGTTPGRSSAFSRPPSTSLSRGPDLADAFRAYLKTLDL